MRPDEHSTGSGRHIWRAGYAHGHTACEPGGLPPLGFHAHALLVVPLHAGVRSLLSLTGPSLPRATQHFARDGALLDELTITDLRAMKLLGHLCSVPGLLQPHAGGAAARAPSKFDSVGSAKSRKNKPHL